VLDVWQQFKRPEESKAVQTKRAEVFAASLAPALEIARGFGVDLPGSALAYTLLRRVLGVD
jgi:hypothetical protein